MWLANNPAAYAARLAENVYYLPARSIVLPIVSPRRGLTLFLKLFTGHEPDIQENTWPFKGFRIEGDGAEEGARIALDSVVLPPVDLAHCFVVTMPIRFEDVTPELVIRIHNIIQLEKPAHAHYYLQFAEESGDVELREFFAIGVRSGIGIGAEVVKPGRLLTVVEAKVTCRTDGKEKPVAIALATIANLDVKTPGAG